MAGVSKLNRLGVVIHPKDAFFIAELVVEAIKHLAATPNELPDELDVTRDVMQGVVVLGGGDEAVCRNEGFPIGREVVLVEGVSFFMEAVL
jgi:hypothetical protein